GLAPRGMVRLCHGLAHALYWQSRYDEAVRLGEEGLAMLGGDRHSVEAALMNVVISVSWDRKGDREKWRRFALRNAPFLLRLPYSEELRLAYTQIALVCLFEDLNAEEGRDWLLELERRAEAHHDLRASADASYPMGLFLANTGDPRAALLRYQQASDC